MPAKTPEGKKPLMERFDEKFRQLKIKAVQDSKPVYELMIDAIDLYLKK